jgi:hypothetical protein
MKSVIEFGKLGMTRIWLENVLYNSDIRMEEANAIVLEIEILRSKLNEAVEVLKELTNSMPMSEGDCAYCGGSSYKHQPNCEWIKARTLLEKLGKEEA